MGESSDTEKWEKIALILQRDVFWVTKASMFNTDSQKKAIFYICSVAGSLRTLVNKSMITRLHEGQVGRPKVHFSFMILWHSAFTGCMD